MTTEIKPTEGKIAEVKPETKPEETKPIEPPKNWIQTHLILFIILCAIALLIIVAIIVFVIIKRKPKPFVNPYAPFGGALLSGKK